MVDRLSQAQLTAPLNALRIIIAALMTGPILFLVFVLLQRRVDDPDGRAEPPIVTYAAAAAGALALIGRFVLPTLVVKAGRLQIARRSDDVPADRKHQPADPHRQSAGQDDVRRLCALYQSKTIVGAALLEAAALFAILSHMLEGQVVAMVVAGVMIGAILIGFPTRSGLEAWLDAQLQLLAEERRRPF